MMTHGSMTQKKTKRSALWPLWRHPSRLPTTPSHDMEKASRITTYLSYEAASLSRKAASLSHKREFPSHEATSLSCETTFLSRIMTGNSPAIEVPAFRKTSGRREQSLTDHGQFTKNRCFRYSGDYSKNPAGSQPIPSNPALRQRVSANIRCSMVHSGLPTPPSSP